MVDSDFVLSLLPLLVFFAVAASYFGGTASYSGPRTHSRWWPGLRTDKTSTGTYQARSLTYRVVTSPEDRLPKNGCVTMMFRSGSSQDWVRFETLPSSMSMGEQQPPSDPA